MQRRHGCWGRWHRAEDKSILRCGVRDCREKVRERDVPVFKKRLRVGQGAGVARSRDQRRRSEADGRAWCARGDRRGGQIWIEIWSHEQGRGKQGKSVLGIPSHNNMVRAFSDHRPGYGLRSESFLASVPPCRIETFPRQASLISQIWISTRPLASDACDPIDSRLKVWQLASNEFCWSTLRHWLIDTFYSNITFIAKNNRRLQGLPIFDILDNQWDDLSHGGWMLGGCLGSTVQLGNTV